MNEVYSNSIASFCGADVLFFEKKWVIQRKMRNINHLNKKKIVEDKICHLKLNSYCMKMWNEKL